MKNTPEQTERPTVPSESDPQEIPEEVHKKAAALAKLLLSTPAED